MTLRAALAQSVVMTVLTVAALASNSAVHAAPTIVETDIAALQSAMARGSESSESLTRAYLSRIDAMDRQGPQTRSVIATNPEALAIARQLDRERKAGQTRGPLHGIPVLVKDTDRLFEQALAHLRQLGVEIVDPVDFGSLGDYDEDELEVLLYELKAGLDAYLSSRPGAAVKSLNDVIAFNEKYALREMRYFGQDLFEKAQAKGPLTEPAYIEAAQRSRRLAREGIDGPMAQYRLDAIVTPTGSPAWLTDHVNGDHIMGASASPAAVAGYPSITVTMGSAMGLPVGLSFVGPAWSEGKLIRLAFAYEQLTRHRRAPDFRP